MEKKKINVFIASSLNLQEERNLIEKVCTERNNELLEVCVYRFESNGDNNIAGDNRDIETQEIIDEVLRRSNVVIFFAGNYIGDMTIREFKVAFENAYDKYIYFFQNPNISPPADKPNYLPWSEFYANNMVENADDKTLVHYEKACFNLEELRDAVVRAREQFTNNPLRPIPCPQLDYNRIIPSVQSNRVNSDLNYYIKRLEVDEELRQSFEENYRMIVVCGPSTSGKTMAVCKMLQTAEDYSVVVVNFDTPPEQLRLMTAAQFVTGKKVLLLDDIQYIVCPDEGGKSVSQSTHVLSVLHEIIQLPNPELKIIATSGYDFDEIMSCLTYKHVRPSNVKEITIRPLSKGDLKEYARELKALGYVSVRTKAVTTIGSLFFDVERLTNQFNFVINNQDRLSKQMLSILCHAIKCLWMWKKRSRNQIKLLVDFLQFTYRTDYFQFTNKSLEGLFHILRNFVTPNYQLGTFEIEDIIVTHVFKYDQQNENSDITKIEKKALIDIFIFIQKQNKEQFFRSATKILHRVGNCANPSALRKFIINTIVERYYPREDVLHKCNEISLNPENTEVNWVDIYIANIILFTETTQEAIDIWQYVRKYREHDHNALRCLLPRLKTEEEKKMVRDQLFNENGTLKETYAKSTFIELQTELINFLNLEQAKELYLNTTFLNTDTKITAELSEDEYWRLVLEGKDDDIIRKTTSSVSPAPARQIKEDADSIYETVQFMNTLKEIRIRNFSQNILIKSSTFEEFISTKTFLQNHNNGVVPQDDKLLFFDFISCHHWGKIINSLKSPQELELLFHALSAQELQEDQKKLFLNKTYIYNLLLNAVPGKNANYMWNRAGENCDGYTLRIMIEKMGKRNFELAKGIFVTFMEKKSVGEKIKIGEIYLNRLLYTTTTISSIKECEDLFHKYNLLRPGESVFDYPGEYTQGLLYQRIDWDSIVAHMRKKRPADGENKCRNIKTIVHVILKAPDYYTVHRVLFGDCPDFLTPKEQQILNQSTYVVSEMFRKVASEEEAITARDFFENQMNKELLNQSGANILNAVINNRYIYPFYEDKINMIDMLSKQCTVVQNDYTEKHLLFHFINSSSKPAGADEIRNAVNDHIMKKLENGSVSKQLLKDMLIQRYHIEGYKNYNRAQTYPVQQDNGEWTVKDMTTLEFVHFMLDNKYCDGKVVAACMDSLVNDNNIEELARLQEKAIENKVLINYEAYAHFKNKGICFSDPYLIVDNYLPLKDICYQLRERTMTYEEAENYITGLEKKHGIHIARTQIYWNNVISQMANENYSGKNLHEILQFITEQKIHISSEIFYFLLHVIKSGDDYLTVKALYKEELNLDHFSILLRQNGILRKNNLPEWSFVNLLREDFSHWYNLLKNVKKARYFNAIHNCSLRYRQHYPIIKNHYLNQTYLFWWTIHYMTLNDSGRQQIMEELKQMIPQSFRSGYCDMIDKYFPNYPQEMKDKIHAHLYVNPKGILSVDQN